MTIQWPVPPEHRTMLCALGFEWYERPGSFAVAYLHHDLVALVEYFVLCPELRNGRHVRVAFNDLKEHLRGLGVRWTIAYAPKMAPLWRRMGMTETERGWLKIRTD